MGLKVFFFMKVILSVRIRFSHFAVLTWSGKTVPTNFGDSNHNILYLLFFDKFSFSKFTTSCLTLDLIGLLFLDFLAKQRPALERIDLTSRSLCWNRQTVVYPKPDFTPRRLDLRYFYPKNWPPVTDGNVSILRPFTDDDLGRLFFGFKSSVLLRTGAAPLLLLRLRRLRRWWGSLHGETGFLFSQRVSTGVGRWETGDPLYFIWMSGMADIFFYITPESFL